MRNINITNKQLWVLARSKNDIIGIYTVRIKNGTQKQSFYKDEMLCLQPTETYCCPMQI